MQAECDGGYDQGYRSVQGFWGTAPASLVACYLSLHNPAGLKVLDVGAGEGKNAAAFASAGALVDAIECSSAAIRNGLSLFPNPLINWIHGDAVRQDYPADFYDVVICYGLVHCLKNEQTARSLLNALKNSLKPGGTIFVVAFNDGSQDLSAHPGFEPLLLSHDWFLEQFSDWQIDSVSNSILFETHPHNEIPHYHSLTRLVAVRP